MTAATAIVVVAIAVLSAVVWYYYSHNPAHGGVSCIFHKLTGYDCPGCGSQRAFHALLHGRIAEAWHFNAFVFFAIPMAAFYGIIEAGRNRWPAFHAKVTRPFVIAVILAAVVLYWILRNCL
ncbi:MAG: DUF2752 domain-containing protein [Muribaculaceae bacterium]|nr:DUF2752 domain-containing protein [Muribaculaceae bacterium]